MPSPYKSNEKIFEYQNVPSETNGLERKTRDSEHLYRVRSSALPKLEFYVNSTCPKIHLGTKLTIPKLAEATKDDQLKAFRPVTTPTLPISKNRLKHDFSARIILLGASLSPVGMRKVEAEIPSYTFLYFEKKKEPSVAAL
ncbi:hypothetical protein JOD43_001913 [Pullulanibacillus pueri]|uniref:Uncharacterized protein n=1 Tax=Pullulanibacillus pueri TaxID=1437324 RepID=A0A8J2ZY10_9BACL|nr:hypothetical protein [Pullulanibacillus pueri]GGH84107.1 hypothetical protein GCM10007096_26420 [Pullulanibacillus pueri]